jgi:hypothetical protein
LFPSVRRTGKTHPYPSTIGAAGNAGRSAHRSRILTDCSQSNAGTSRAGIETLSVVGDGQKKTPAFRRQRDGRLGGARMPDDVRDTLRTAIKLHLDSVGRLLGQWPEIQLQQQLNAQAARFHQRFQRFLNSLLLPVRRMKPNEKERAPDPAPLPPGSEGVRWLCAQIRPAEDFPGRIRYPGGAFIQYFQMKFDSGHWLSRAGVQLPGDSRSLALKLRK